MSQEIEEIKKILIKYDSTIKEVLERELVDSKSVYNLEESLNEIVNNVLTTDLDIMDIVLICNQLEKLEKKKYKMLSNESVKDDKMNEKIRPEAEE